jgi:predicted ester cyclase
MKKITIALLMGLLLANKLVFATCTEDQKYVMDKMFYEGFPGGNMEVLEEVFHPDFILEHPSLPPGVEGLKKIVEMNNHAFKDWHFIVHDLICDGDKVVARYTGTGIHVNSFMGEEPTNKKVELDGISIYIIKNRQIIADWYAPDDLGFLTQLGVIPPMQD